MASSETQELIKEGDQVVVKRDNILKAVKICKSRSLYMEKCKFLLDGAIGQPYGTAFEVKQGTLVKLEKKDFAADVNIDLESGKDNRNLQDSCGNQKLGRDDIQAMKKDMAGGEIVDLLVEHSATFKQKTEYAQQKYLKKKKKKYTPVFIILKPNTRLMVEMYYNRGPTKICNLRMDSVAQILCQGNVRANSKLMVVESCVGLLLGAIMEKMGGHGTVIQFYSGCAPVRQAATTYNFPTHYFDTVQSFPLDQLSTLHQATGQSDDTQEKSEETEMEVAAAPVEPTTLPGEESMPLEPDPEGKDLEGDGNASKGDIAVAEEGAVDTPDDIAEDNEEDGRPRKRKHEPVTEEERERKKQIRIQQLTDTRQLLAKADMDGLIVATKYHPTPIVLSLIDFVAPSRPIVVFSQYKEPLLDCYVKLRDRSGVINLRLTETWLREYQILPSRSHPLNNMSGTGGFLLTATTVVMK